MSKSQQPQQQEWKRLAKKGIPKPDPTMGCVIEPEMPLHRHFIHRMQQGRDLKVIITAQDSATGTGKTTLAFWLAHQWQQLFAPTEWSADRHATLDAEEYLKLYQELPSGSVLLLDEAEDLDARRSMSSKNVNFSHYWMKMRVRQVATILTLPSTTALDSRLEELADVWIDVERRGSAWVHSLQVNSYSKRVLTTKEHKITWPNVADHPEMQALDEMKQENIQKEIDGVQEEEKPDPADVAKETKIEDAQSMRNRGLTTEEIGEIIGYSQSWVSRNTVPEEEYDEE